MRVAFLTGATKNTGLAIARRFAADGYALAITSRNKDDAQRTANALQEEYAVPCCGYALALNDPNAIAKVFSEVEAKLGPVSVFVANAAVLGIGKGLCNTTEADFDEIVEVNLKGTFFCCQCAAEQMKRAGGGCILTIGSVQSLGAVPDRCVYSMTKAALSALAKNMAYELGSWGIRANNIVAGAIHSSRYDALSPEELVERRSRYPAGRESTEEEIAAAAAYLASESAATITGTDLVIDSGLSACLLPYKKANHSNQKEVQK